MSAFGGRISVPELASRCFARLWFVAAAVLILHWATGLDVSARTAGEHLAGALGIEAEEPSLRLASSSSLPQPSAQGEGPAEPTEPLDADTDAGNDPAKAFVIATAWRFALPIGSAATIAIVAGAGPPAACGRAFNPRAPPLDVT